MSKGNRMRHENQHRAMRGDDFREAPLGLIHKDRPAPPVVELAPRHESPPDDPYACDTPAPMPARFWLAVAIFLGLVTVAAAAVLVSLIV